MTNSYESGEDKRYNSHSIQELQYWETTGRTHAGHQSKQTRLEEDLDANGVWANKMRAYEERRS